MTENFYQSESAHHSQISYSGLPGEEKSSSFANNKKSRLSKNSTFCFHWRGCCETVNLQSNQTLIDRKPFKLPQLQERK